MKRIRFEVVYKWFLLIALCGPSIARSAGDHGPSGGIWRFGSLQERFVLHELKEVPFKVRVSEVCASSTVAAASRKGGAECEAWRALRQAADPDFRKKNRGRIPGSSGGAEPGSRICRGVFGASVALADDEKSNRNAFCTFGDGSRVSTGSLSSVWEFTPATGPRRR